MNNMLRVRFGTNLMSTQTPIASAMILECAEYDRYTPDGTKIDNPNYEGDWDADITSEVEETVAQWILKLYPDSKVEVHKETFCVLGAGGLLTCDLKTGDVIACEALKPKRHVSYTQVAKIDIRDLKKYMGVTPLKDATVGIEDVKLWLKDGTYVSGEP